MANAADKEAPKSGAQEKQAKAPRAPKQPAESKEGKAAPAAATSAKADAQAAAPASGEKPARQQARPAGAKGGPRAPAAKAAAAVGRPARPAQPARLETMYKAQVVQVLKREFGYKNPMQVPKLQKISVNIGMGEALKSSGAIDAALGDVTLITGQKPVVTKARKAIANFNLREGQAIGVMVTLRGDRMWQFLDRLISVALPRMRDFRGLPRSAFDGRGNYTLGLKEQIVFPEIDYNKVDRMRGMQINMITSARTDEEGRRLLELLGMPFVKPDQNLAGRKN